jgi:hypothetical protein
MPATEAQIRTAKENGAKSKGPTSAEGKDISKKNSYKHGLTATVVLPEREAAEVKRRFAAFVDELKPTGEVGAALALHAARMAVRMERCAEHENAMLTDRVRQVLDEYEYPEGLDEAGIAKLRNEISKKAMFDDSKEACLARKYEASAERGFFKALKELRVLEKQNKQAEDEQFETESGSFSLGGMTDAEFDRFEAEFNPVPDLTSYRRVQSDALAELRSRADLPFAVGKPR